MTSWFEIKIVCINYFCCDGSCDDRSGVSCGGSCTRSCDQITNPFPKLFNRRDEVSPVPDDVRVVRPGLQEVVTIQNHHLYPNINETE